MRLHVFVSFNPHTHEGCDVQYTSDAACPLSFNPHTHEGCDFTVVLLLVMFLCFNPHTHEGCDCPKLMVMLLDILFQSTHPRRVWLVLLVHYLVVFLVSIHTPTKGVTYIRYSHTYLIKFQSTHPRRVWLMVIFLFLHRVCFNPHTHEGCDTLLFLYYGMMILVSIHTPTKGVTFTCFLFHENCVCFNPHTHEGCDKYMFMQDIMVNSFNPHTHEGCDFCPL